MPSFLSKVFNRKKHEGSDDGRHASDPTLLEGKFEAVSPTVSPTATHFPEPFGKEKEKEKDGLFGLSRSKHGPSSPDRSHSRLDDLPHLTLNLPGPKDENNARALGVVFEADPELQVLLSDAEIGEKRLSPLETLILVKACSHNITERGLETLGIMHPHWYSASPDKQRKLISLFIQSLAHKTPITTLSPTPSSAASAFESELSFTRSPHDVAAVLRWGLRHLKIDGTTFGKGSDEWSWYSKFSQTERESSYPPKIYSERLVPELIPAHVELLNSTLEILSSLAAHSEANSTSGSKLSKLFGLWLLCAARFDPKDDWSAFYARWERAGRILEHLFLARIRDEAANLRMPTRLLELVRHYPFTKEDKPTYDLLPLPRFTTRRYNALLVRVDSEVFGTNTPPAKPTARRLIAEALTADAPAGGKNDAAWDELKKASLAEEGEAPGPTADGYPAFNRIFASETLRLLSLVPGDKAPEEPLSPTFSLLPQVLAPPGHSLPSEKDKGKVANGDAATPANDTTKPPVSLPTELGATAPGSRMTEAAAADWAQFSSAGFSEANTVGQALAATLLDTDVEKTEPPAASPRKNKKRKATAVSPIRGRPSIRDDKRSPLPGSPVCPIDELTRIVSKSTAVTVVQLDEAFIDFWSDALLDPVSSSWPSFVICKLRDPVTSLPSADKPVEWLVIEHFYTIAPPPPSSPVDESSAKLSKKTRPSSPKPSFRSDISGLRMSSTLAATRKRLSFLTGSRSGTSGDESKGKRGGPKSQKVGEMGEILAEEEEKAGPSDVNKDGADAGSGGSVGAGTVGVGVAAVAAVAAAAEVITEPSTAIAPPATVPQATKIEAPAETDIAEDQTAQAEETVEEPAEMEPSEAGGPTVVSVAESEVVQSTEVPAAVEEPVQEPNVLAAEATEDYVVVEEEEDTVEYVAVAEEPEVLAEDVHVPEAVPVSAPVHEPLVEEEPAETAPVVDVHVPEVEPPPAEAEPIETVDAPAEEAPVPEPAPLAEAPVRVEETVEHVPEDTAIEPQAEPEVEMIAAAEPAEEPQPEEVVEVVEDVVVEETPVETEVAAEPDVVLEVNADEADVHESVPEENSAPLQLGD